MREKRDETIILRLRKTEKSRIYEKMLSMGIRSLSAYIRKMALDGYCLHLDLKDLQRMAYLLQMCSNNLNQYAKAANENGRVYAADLEDLRARLDGTGVKVDGNLIDRSNYTAKEGSTMKDNPGTPDDRFLSGNPANHNHKAVQARCHMSAAR